MNPVLPIHHQANKLQSLVPGVNTIDTMDDCMWPSLNYQVMFVRKTSPWERSEWDDEELSDFTLELEEVDRLYYIHENQSSDDNDYFHILARVCRGGGGETKKEEKKKEKKESHQYLFVELSASCDNTGFECQGWGDIFVTKSANIFFQVTLREDYFDDNRDAIRESLCSDGYILDHLILPQPHHPFQQSAPMLKFLCHEAINDHKDLLAHVYSEVLPPILRDSVQEFINLRETIDDYDR